MSVKRFLGIAALAVMAASCASSARIRRMDPGSWHIYQGKFQDYKAEINQSSYGGIPERFVHLVAENEGKKPYGITGHDYDGNGTWERVFIWNSYDEGCTDSVYFEPNGRQVWEPSDASWCKGGRPTPAQLIQAKKMLDDTTVAIGRDEYESDRPKRIQAWVDSWKKK